MNLYGLFSRFLYKFSTSTKSIEILNAIKSNPDAINTLVPLLFIARYLERVGDQATNIAEETHFIVTGEDLTDEAKIQIENETTF